MKKIILALFVLAFAAATPAYAAIDLNKLADAVSNNSADSKNGKKSGSPLGGIEDRLVEKLEQKLDKITGRIEERIEKYEKKFDEYEKKLDNAEKAADRIVTAINGVDLGKVKEYLVIAKYAAIAFVSLFILMLVLLIAVFFQLLRANALLRKASLK